MQSFGGSGRACWERRRRAVPTRGRSSGSPWRWSSRCRALPKVGGGASVVAGRQAGGRAGTVVCARGAACCLKPVVWPSPATLSPRLAGPAHPARGRFPLRRPPSPPAAGVSVKYGKKLLGKLQRAPAAAAALAAAADAAREVLVPGFDEAMAAAEAAERRANPAAALPDDLFSDEPPAAARQPCAAERRSAAAEGGLEAALAEARSLRAFLQEAALEAGERVLAALQQRRGARQAHQAAAAAAAAVAARAQHLPAALGAGLAGAGQLSQLPLLAAAPAGAAVHDGHDGLTLDNECVICMADIRCAWVGGQAFRLMPV